MDLDKLSVWCHVHSGVWEREPGGFISSPLGKVVERWTLPVVACPKCRLKGPAAVREAYMRFTGRVA